MAEKVAKAIIKAIVTYLICVGMVAIGWNAILTYLFSVPMLSFGRLCLFTLAISLIATPITISRHCDSE